MISTVLQLAFVTRASGTSTINHCPAKLAYCAGLEGGSIHGSEGWQGTAVCLEPDPRLDSAETTRGLNLIS